MIQAQPSFFSQLRYSISLSQSHYINKPLKYFGIEGYIPIKTSLSPEIDLSSLVPMPFEQSKIKSVSYLSAMDSLQYLETITQLDIYFATQKEPAVISLYMKRVMIQNYYQVRNMPRRRNYLQENFRICQKSVGILSDICRC